ncbi:hypothetical protein LTR49_026038 [Elasticomyces elasticus]|nr:hypothetical protein LTR49_026038 [Elasticomyces elasticus]
MPLCYGSSVYLSGVPTGEDWRRLGTLCEAFAHEGVPYSIRVAESHLAAEDIGCIQNGSSTTLVSLRTSLAVDSQEFMQDIGRNDRIVLAWSYATSVYLHVSRTPWWRHHDVRPDFWFPTAVPPIEGFDNRQPFVNFASEELSDIGGSSVETWMNTHRPSLPALGKLLLKIWKGSQVDWKDLEATTQECSRDDTGQYWLCAINICLGADAALKADGNLKVRIIKKVGHHVYLDGYEQFDDDMLAEMMDVGVRHKRLKSVL